MSRLSGHELFNEGAPFSDNGRQRLNPTGTSGLGRGKCSCLALSPLLTSGNARKQWHREHKNQIIDAANRRTD